MTVVRQVDDLGRRAGALAARQNRASSIQPRNGRRSARSATTPFDGAGSLAGRQSPAPSDDSTPVDGLVIVYAPI
jgi:hypothetical protein